MQVVSSEQRQFERWILTGEGQDVVEKGSHEARVYHAVAPDEGTLQSEIMVYPTSHTHTRILSLSLTLYTQIHTHISLLLSPNHAHTLIRVPTAHDSLYHSLSHSRLLFRMQRWDSARQCRLAGYRWTNRPPMALDCTARSPPSTTQSASR